MSVFQNQGLLALKLDTGQDVSSASVRRILYKKPDGSSGYWTASLEGTTVLVYNMLNTDLDQYGVWTFQSFVTIAGKDGYGEYVQKEIKAKLN